MYRMYKITLNDNNVSNESVYVSYQNLNSILDCSADHISCDILQKIPFDSQVVKTISDKIKPNGIVIFTILDIPKIAKNYIYNFLNLCTKHSGYHLEILGFVFDDPMSSDAKA